MQREGYRGTQLSGQTRGQVLSHRQDPQTMRKSPFSFCATSPSQRRGERHGGRRGGGQQYRTALALAVACAVIPMGQRRSNLNIQKSTTTFPLCFSIDLEMKTGH